MSKYMLSNTSKISKIELLALIKNYNKTNNEKIKNADKLKKDELINLCVRYKIIDDNDTDGQIMYDLYAIKKRDLQKDVEVHFLKQNKAMPPAVIAMKKRALIEFMELNGIYHYDQQQIEKEITEYEQTNMLKNIIIYNIMKYDDINVTELDNDNLAEYIKSNDIDTDIKNLNHYAVLLHKIYSAYDEFRNGVYGKSHVNDMSDKIKSFPKIIRRLQDICMKN